MNKRKWKQMFGALIDFSFLAVDFVFYIQQNAFGDQCC